jgi:hypothetical protein
LHDGWIVILYHYLSSFLGDNVSAIAVHYTVSASLGDFSYICILIFVWRKDTPWYESTWFLEVYDGPMSVCIVHQQGLDRLEHLKIESHQGCLRHDNTVPHLGRPDPRVIQRISDRYDQDYPSGPHWFFHFTSLRSKSTRRVPFLKRET